MVEIFLFLLGLCIGSFINCLVYRLNENQGKGLFWGRSFCPKCKHQLAWYDNIPLLSFLLLGGRCRYCHQPISIHYPLVELVTGLLTLLVFYEQMVRSVNLYVIGYWLLINYSLIALSLSDLLYQTIPDEIVWPAIGISLIYLLLTTYYLLLFSGFAAGLFFLALVLITHGRGMGLGDVKLAALMGLFLGYPGIVVALYLAFLTGALVGVILIILGKKRFGEQIPFGPFLSTAAIISLFWGELIWKKVGELLLLSF